MNEEIWKPIVYRGIDYTGRYEVSNFGRIRALRHSVPKILCTPVNKKSGYCEVSLPIKYPKYHYTTVHRLVLMMFNPVEGMDNLEVNHIDECKTNNVLTNLEWVTSKQNCNYGTRNARLSEHRSCDAILCIETKQIFSSQLAACKELNLRPEDLCVHLSGKRQCVKNLHFVRLSDYGCTVAVDSQTINGIVMQNQHLIGTKVKHPRSKILCVETGQVYKSQMEAARQTGILQPSISAALSGQSKQAGGYTWKRIEST